MIGLLLLYFVCWRVFYFTCVVSVPNTHHFAIAIGAREEHDGERVAVNGVGVGRGDDRGKGGWDWLGPRFQNPGAPPWYNVCTWWYVVAIARQAWQSPQ